MTDKFDEQKILHQLAYSHIQEQKRKRRWSIFFRLMGLLIGLVVIYNVYFAASAEQKGSNQPHIGIVKVNGVMGSDYPANTKNISQSLHQAFDNDQTKAVFLKINSPGGSPVEADDLYQYINYLKTEHPDKPIYAICTDMCASAAYYIASATDKIYANRMTLLGSIGVRGGGFGFVGLLDKLGIERRLYTAGDNKDFLDPFKPQNARQVKIFESILDQVHDVFIDAVKKGRKDRLDLTKAQQIFSGQPFDGIQGKKLGLIDDYGSVGQIARGEFDALPIVDYTRKSHFLDRLVDQMGTQAATTLQNIGTTQLEGRY